MESLEHPYRMIAGCEQSSVAPKYNPFKRWLLCTWRKHIGIKTELYEEHGPVLAGWSDDYSWERTVCAWHCLRCGATRIFAKPAPTRIETIWTRVEVMRDDLLAKKRHIPGRGRAGLG